MHGGLIETTYESNVVGTDEIAETIQDLLEGLSEYTWRNYCNELVTKFAPFFVGSPF